MDWLRWILLLIGAAIVAAIWWTGHRRARERDETLFQRASRESDTPSTEEPEAGEAAHGVGQADAAPDLDISSFSPFPADEPAPDLEVHVERAPEGADEAPPRDEPVRDAQAGPADPARSSPAAGAGAAVRRDRPTKAGAGGTGGEGEERIESVFLVAGGGERLVGSRLQGLFSRLGLRHGEMGIFHLHDPEGHIQFSVANLVEPGTFDPATMDTLSTPGIAFFVRLPGPPSAEIAFDRMIRTARAMADELDARLLDQQQSTFTRQTEQHLRDEMRAWDHRQRQSRA